MKKNQSYVFLFGALFTLGIYAQELIPDTRSNCNRKCFAYFGDPERETKYSVKLRKILAAKAKETEPEKLKQLEKQEKEETEKMRDAVENMCDSFCKVLPE